MCVHEGNIGINMSMEFAGPETPVLCSIIESEELVALPARTVKVARQQDLAVEAQQTALAPIARHSNPKLVCVTEGDSSRNV